VWGCVLVCGGGWVWGGGGGGVVVGGGVVGWGGGGVGGGYAEEDACHTTDPNAQCAAVAPFVCLHPRLHVLHRTPICTYACVYICGCANMCICCIFYAMHCSSPTCAPLTSSISTAPCPDVYICKYVYMCLYEMCACRHVLSNVLQEPHLYIRIHVCVHLYICVHMIVRAYMCIYIHIYVHKYIRLYVHMYICIYSYIYTCMYIHTYICIQVSIALTLLHAHCAL